MPPSETFPQTLADGLRLRRSTAADAEALADFNAAVHGEGETALTRAGLADWTRDLLSGAHPTFRPEDFTVVDDPRTGQIISCVGLISQTWAYAGVPFPAGRPELVGTRAEYRGRGLVRRQFEIIHAWSAARGELVQAITGIPWYYRQFGYEMGLALGGGRRGYASQVPRLAEGAAEPFRVRPATEADLPFFAECYAAGGARGPLACVWDAALWRHELLEKSPANINRRELRVIETAAGERVGSLAHPPTLWDGALLATHYEVRPGRSWLAVTPSVIRYLWAAGGDYAARDGQTRAAFGFGLGTEHPVYQAAGACLPHERAPYAWYVRVPDLPAFLRRVAPALERRLAASCAAGHTGEVKVSFYRAGLRLQLEQGRLTVAPWRPVPKLDEGQAAFPEHTFLHLLFGHRRLDELKHLYRDCWTTGDEPRVLLEALFPQQASDLWPVS